MNLRALGTLLSLVAFGCSSEAEPPGAGAGGTTTSAGNANMAGASGATTAGGSGNTAGGGAAAGGSGGSGTGGTSEGGASVAGAGSGAGGSGGGSAGGAGTAGKGTGGSASYDVPRGMSAGCGKDAIDEPGEYVKHELDVKGVDPSFETAHPLSPGNNGGYTYERRNYFIQLPPGYDKSKPYPVTLGGSGCGDTSGLSGRNGGQQPSGMTAIQVGLSYVYSGGACFEDGYENTPEVPYFDAVLAELEERYCIDKGKVFLSGFSSGAWEAITLGLARGGIVRGIATGAGGLREKRPVPSRVPMAAILLTGKNDGANPIDGPTGSAAARDLILATNGCVGTETQAFAGDADCKRYTGCPAAFPVVWCEPAGEHMAGSDAHWKAVGEFWSALPAVP